MTRWLTYWFFRSGVKGQGHMLDIVVKPCKYDTDWTVPARTVKLGIHKTSDKDQGTYWFSRSGVVKVTHYTLFLNLVNIIQTEPFLLGPSNLVHIVLMTRGRHLLIFKVSGQMSRSNLVNKINPFYIANYNAISLLNSPVGRSQRWHCSCCVFSVTARYCYTPGVHIGVHM